MAEQHQGSDTHGPILTRCDGDFAHGRGNYRPYLTTCVANLVTGTHRTAVAVVAELGGSMSDARLSRRSVLTGLGVLGAAAAFPPGAGAGPPGAGAPRPARRAPAVHSTGRRVAVLGGGMAGLTAAHELAERGFDVTVYEPTALGGKARSIPVARHRPGGRKDLPGEHGFRFFPGFYHHIPDTMRRIPFAGNAERRLDNLVVAAAARRCAPDGRADAPAFGIGPTPTRRLRLEGCSSRSVRICSSGCHPAAGARVLRQQARWSS